MDLSEEKTAFLEGILAPRRVFEGRKILRNSPFHCTFKLFFFMKRLEFFWGVFGLHPMFAACRGDSRGRRGEKGILRGGGGGEKGRKAELGEFLKRLPSFPRVLLNSDCIISFSGGLDNGGRGNCDGESRGD